VTIDAMGCQVAIADEIVEHKADYLLALKCDQPTLKPKAAAMQTPLCLMLRFGRTSRSRRAFEGASVGPPGPRLRTIRRHCAPRSFERRRETRLRLSCFISGVAQFRPSLAAHRDAPFWGT
jgi:hypothetical protein